MEREAKQLAVSRVERVAGFLSSAALLSFRSTRLPHPV
jgi:hypothetical protein